MGRVAELNASNPENASELEKMLCGDGEGYARQSCAD